MFIPPTYLFVEKNKKSEKIITFFYFRKYFQTNKKTASNRQRSSVIKF